MQQTARVFTILILCGIIPTSSASVNTTSYTSSTSDTSSTPATSCQSKGFSAPAKIQEKTNFIRFNSNTDSSNNGVTNYYPWDSYGRVKLDTTLTLLGDLNNDGYDDFIIATGRTINLGFRENYNPYKNGRQTSWNSWVKVCNRSFCEFTPHEKLGTRRPYPWEDLAEDVIFSGVTVFLNNQ